MSRCHLPNQQVARLNIVADENVDRPIVERLREDGHAVLFVAETDPGVDDEVVLDRANELEAGLLTARQ